MQLNIGDIYALLAAICWSIGVVLFDVSGKTLNSLQMNLLKNVIGFIGFICVLLYSSSLFVSYSNYEYFLLIISGILGVALGDLFLLAGLKRLGSGLYAITGTSYTLFVFIFVYFMYQETISLQVCVGGILVIIGILSLLYMILVLICIKINLKINLI